MPCKAGMYTPLGTGDVDIAGIVSGACGTTVSTDGS